MTKIHTQWHDDDRYFGLHYDLHANEADTVLGKYTDAETLVPLLKHMNPDWVQTDCKGHPGYTSWFSQVPDASISPGVVNDAMAGWRAATQALTLPLHCHYSGVYDKAAGVKHPEWCMLDREGKPYTESSRADESPTVKGLMSTNGPYIDELLIPQLLELIDRYEIDGFWVDGEVWAVQADYSEYTTSKFKAETGIETAPTDPEDPNWNRWMQFNRDSFHRYVTRYCEAVHQHKPGVLVCSNWLQTFRHPGEPSVPTDWISGDNTWVWGLDGSRCEARFISTRGKRWDIMLWSFYKIGDLRDRRVPWTFKPVQMLQQEAAITLALGGAIQIYDNGGYVRDGRIPAWRLEKLGQVGQFVKARQAICQHTETIPQVAILHSEHHYYADARQPFPTIPSKARPVQAATFAMLEDHYGVDILDEWALTPCLDEFALVVASECHQMSEQMVTNLKRYVNDGGCLLLTGSAAYERFGPDFLGAKSARVETDVAYHIIAAESAVPVFSPTWRHLAPATAKPYGQLGQTAAPDDYLLPHPAAVINAVGKGKVAYIPYDLFAFFYKTRYPMLRQFVGALAAELVGDLPIRMSGPAGVEMILRQRTDQMIIHLINLTSGLPNNPNAGAIDEIPLVGPLKLEVEVEHRPESVTAAFENGQMDWDYQGGLLEVMLETLHIHQAIIVEKQQNRQD